jgi:N-acetylneuraminate lyase
MASDLQGILPALVTPLASDETVKSSAVEQLLRHVYDAGAHGVYLCGNTGEGMGLAPAERRKVVEVSMRSSPRSKLVVVHVGAASQREAIELGQHAAKMGVSAVSSLPPGGCTFAEIVAYYRALAAAIDAPVVAYYFPAVAGASWTRDQLAEICAIPGVAGIKYTDFDLYTMSLLARDGYTFFNGRDEVLAAGMLMGAAGGIGSIYNVAPQWFVELYDHARAGRWSEARSVQDRINDLIRLLLRYPLIPAIKRVLLWGGIDCGQAVSPRRPLTAAEEVDLLASIECMELPLPAERR